MATTHQNGYIKPTGDRVKTWTGYYKVKVGDTWIKRSKVIGPRAGMSKGEAKSALARFIQGARYDSGITFLEAYERWYAIKQADWERSHRGQVTSAFKCHILPALGKKPISSIVPSDIRALFVACATSGSKLSKVATHVRSVFEMLLEDDLIRKNPARRAATPLPKVPRKPAGRYLLIDEIRALMAAATGQDRVILRVMLACALRPSEALALRPNDIEPGRLRIDEAYTTINGLKSTKTEGSEGYVPVSYDLERLLREHAETVVGNDYLFTIQGEPVTPDHYLKNSIKKIAERAGVPNVTAACLRRTTATHMQHHGAVKSAQGLLRHAHASTTLQHYQKTIPADVVDAANSWDAELTEGKG